MEKILVRFRRRRYEVKPLGMRNIYFIWFSQQQYGVVVNLWEYEVISKASYFLQVVFYSFLDGFMKNCNEYKTRLYGKNLTALSSDYLGNLI